VKNLTALSGQDFKSVCVFNHAGGPPENLTGLSSRVPEPIAFDVQTLWLFNHLNALSIRVYGNAQRRVQGQ
jgi:hypothetical protein